MRKYEPCTILDTWGGELTGSIPMEGYYNDCRERARGAARDAGYELLIGPERRERVGLNTHLLVYSCVKTGEA